MATALTQAKSNSCTGRIDVLGHSMGATLAAREIGELRPAGSVRPLSPTAGPLELRQLSVQRDHQYLRCLGIRALAIPSSMVSRARDSARVPTRSSRGAMTIVCSTGICTVGEYILDGAGRNWAVRLRVGAFRPAEPAPRSPRST